MATLKDVAQRASVSTSTASRILQGEPIRISPETRERVLKAAEELEYRPNLLARGLRKRSTHTIGVIIPDIQNPVYSQMILGAEEVAQEHGFALIVMHSGSEHRRKAFLDMLSSDRVDGILVADATLDDGTLERMLDRSGAIVALNREFGGAAPWAMLDEKAGAALAVRHLLELGHRNIAYLSGPMSVPTARKRLEGVREELGQWGLKLPSQWLFECGFNGQGVAAAVDNIMWRKEPISAVACASVVIAVSAQKALLQRGFRIPEDLSLVGYHDASFAQYMSPGLTTVRMPLESLGRRGVELLLARIRGQEVESGIVREPQPVMAVRQSTAPWRVGP